MANTTKHPKQAHPSMEVSSQEKLDALLQATTYPEQTQTVDMRETHMSWVFLTEHRVYKLKKPVRRDFLDFSTLAARHWDCREELRLNRRLAKHVYLAVVPLVLTESGRLRLGGEGAIVDWLVKMRRLASGQMLDDAIRGRCLDATATTRVARLLAVFYTAAQPILLSCEEYKQRLTEDVETNRKVLSDTTKLDVNAVNRVCDSQQRFIVEQSDMFCERVDGRWIVEGHGDLRPEHIFLGIPPAVIDCLEFDRDLRLLDPADELAFLAIECERVGESGVGERFMRVYRETRKDSVPSVLVDFYKSCRAGLRARLAVWHVREPGLKGATHWWSMAGEYLRLADRYAPNSRDGTHG